MIVAKAFLFISFVSAHKYSLKKCKKMTHFLPDPKKS